jgi:hypothetical protein
MTYAGMAGQALTEIAPEILAHQTHVPLIMELLMVISGDSAGFLPSVLQGMKPKSDQQGRLWMAENADDATFLTGLVVI